MACYGLPEPRDVFVWIVQWLTGVHKHEALVVLGIRSGLLPSISPAPQGGRNKGKDDEMRRNKTWTTICHMIATPSVTYYRSSFLRR